jgi:hypothetical protein
MSDNLQHSFEEINRDLAPSWIELSSRVSELAASLKLKSAGTELAADADHLSQETDRLCRHVERLHAEVIDLVENLESRIPFREADASPKRNPADVEHDEVQKESIQIQREKHELRNDFKDVLKALFMWVDDPVERVREKK